MKHEAQYKQQFALLTDLHLSASKWIPFVQLRNKVQAGLLRLTIRAHSQKNMTSSLAYPRRAVYQNLYPTEKIFHKSIQKRSIRIEVLSIRNFESVYFEKLLLAVKIGSMLLIPPKFLRIFAHTCRGPYSPGAPYH